MPNFCSPSKRDETLGRLPSDGLSVPLRWVGAATRLHPRAADCRRRQRWRRDRPEEVVTLRWPLVAAAAVAAEAEEVEEVEEGAAWK